MCTLCYKHGYKKQKTNRLRSQTGWSSYEPQAQGEAGFNLMSSRSKEAVGQNQRAHRIKKLKLQTTQGRWQAAKSALTRGDTLDAALRCFLKLGYSATTTLAIAKEAGVSRGAVVHHFPTRQDLVRAAIECLAVRRMDDFKNLLANLPPDVPQEQAGLEAYWRHLGSPDFLVFHELVVMARTDPVLEALLRPSLLTIEAQWRSDIRTLFPQWAKLGEKFEFAMDLTQFLLETIALRRWIDGEDERYQKLKRFLMATYARMSVAPEKGLQPKNQQ
jgi:AcrR family transcriptional regulator